MIFAKLLNSEVERKHAVSYGVIIVDDEKKIREGLALTVPWKELGFEVIMTFENSLLTLDYLQAQAVDVLLTDIKMPILDGIELVEKAKKLYPNLVAVFISGYRDFEYAQNAVRLGAWHYITKPIQRDEIIDVFRGLKIKLDKEHGKGASPLSVSPIYYGKIISKVKQYMEDEFAIATLEGAALRVELSAGYLSKLFKEKTGANFSEYLLECKMTHAVELLENTMMKHYEIADIVGYDNPKNFSRSFKQYYGMSPRQYQEKGQG